MRDPAKEAQALRRGQGELVSGVLTFPFRFLGALLGSLLLSVVIEFVGMHLWWPEVGWRHAEQMYHYELEQLSDEFRQSLIVSEPSATAAALTQRTYELVFVETGLLQWATQRSNHSDETRSSRVGVLDPYVTEAYTQLESHLRAAAYTMLTFMVRLIVLTLTLPTFAMAAFAGLVDGLVRRDLRRFQAGLESGYIFHRVAGMVVPTAVVPWVLYLSIPISIHPMIIVLPTATLLFLSVNITAATFKKYL